MKIALVYGPAVDGSGGPAGPELTMPPIGIGSLSAYLQKHGYICDLFDLMLEFDTEVVHNDFRRPLADLFAAMRSDQAYDPAALTNLRFFLGLNRSRLAGEVLSIFQDADDAEPRKAAQSIHQAPRFLAQAAEYLAAYDVVGLSVVLEEQNLPAVVLAQWIKAMAPKTKIVVGGPGFHPDDWIDQADLTVRGDGEAALLSYVEALDASGESCSDAISPEETSVRFYEHLDDLPTPDYGPLFARYRYLAPVRIIPLAITRGCYWSRCLFCTFGWKGSDAGQCTAPYRRMSAVKIVSDIAEQIRLHDARYFFFSVDVADPALLEAIADELLRTETAIYWSTEVRAEERFLKPGLLQKLYRSGCRSMTCGYESFNQRVLDSMRKGIRVEHSRELLARLYETGIFSNINYFMGWPGETPAEAAETQRAVNTVFEKVPGNAAERFVPVPDSPVVQMSGAGTWPPLTYDAEERQWRKRGMSWEAQNRQWMVFAANFYGDSRYGCFSVRGDGGYGLLYAGHYPPAILGALFRDTGRSFGWMAEGRLMFYGFYHARYYLARTGARFNYDAFVKSRLSPDKPPAEPESRPSKMERLQVAWDFVRDFIGSHDLSDDERHAILEIARFDYGLLASCLSEDGAPLVRVDEDGELLPSVADGGASPLVLSFARDVEQATKLVPLAGISFKPGNAVAFDVNGFRTIEA